MKKNSLVFIILISFFTLLTSGSFAQKTYKKEFKGMGDFLGTGTIAPHLRKYRSYEKAKKYAQSLKLKGVKEWTQHTKSKNFPKDIPAYPSTYKKEFEGMKIFLGNNKKP